MSIPKPKPLDRPRTSTGDILAQGTVFFEVFNFADIPLTGWRSPNNSAGVMRLLAEHQHGQIIDETAPAPDIQFREDPEIGVGVFEVLFYGFPAAPSFSFHKKHIKFYAGRDATSPRSQILTFDFKSSTFGPVAAPQVEIVYVVTID